MVDNKVLFCHWGWFPAWTSNGKGRRPGELVGRWTAAGWCRREALALVPAQLGYSCCLRQGFPGLSRVALV